MWFLSFAFVEIVFRFNVTWHFHLSIYDGNDPKSYTFRSSLSDGIIFGGFFEFAVKGLVRWNINNNSSLGAHNRNMFLLYLSFFLVRTETSSKRVRKFSSCPGFFLSRQKTMNYSTTFTRRRFSSLFYYYHKVHKFSQQQSKSFLERFSYRETFHFSSILRVFLFSGTKSPLEKLHSAFHITNELTRTQKAKERNGKKAHENYITD